VADPPRKRRWPLFLAIVVVLLGFAAWWVDRQMEPARLTATVLARAGTALGLEFTVDGTPEYALRPEPRLVLPGLTVRQPGAAAPLLTAVRAEISLPWDTITGGESLVVTRIELQRPALSLAALADWQATRPEAPFELPTFTKGLHVEDGSVLGGDWRMDALRLDLPELRAGDAARLSAGGVFTRDATTLDFDATAALATAGLASDFEFAGKGRLRSDGLDVPWTLAADGRFDAGGEATLLDVAALSLASASPVPDLDAKGQASFGDNTRIGLQGSIKQWPEGWPVLPAPMSASTSPLAYTVSYAGAADFSAPIALVVVRDQTRFEGRFVLAEITAWVDAADAAPLPPLLGTVSTPSLEISGATLEGVTLQIEEDAPAEAEPQPKP
jgi:hypothetical protein